MSVIQTIEGSIVTQLQTIPYFGIPGRARGVADISTILNLGDIVAPAALVQFRGEAVAGAEAKPMIGLPIESYWNMGWFVYLLASSFGTTGEGRQDQAGETGSYQQIDDVFAALQGFQADPAHDSRMVYEGSAFHDILGKGQIAYISKWRHRVRRVGTISS